MAERKTKARAKKVNPGIEGFVYMDKVVKVLEIGSSTGKNVILFGPGGHGKSELTLEFFANQGIEPYVLTMGSGMTTDRLFGGIDIKQIDTTGKIEYLVENSFMNHEYVIFEELFDAPDFILEQLKDILSSKKFRNGSQIFDIKTKFVVCCTNRTRDEFSKNMSLKALMERFPLELNVIWDNYTEITYTKLLEAKYGVGNIDPIIPYLLQSYAKENIIVSPRVAVIAYDIYLNCGADSLVYIAEFAKNTSLIGKAVKEFEGSLQFRNLSGELTSLVDRLKENKLTGKVELELFESDFKELKTKFDEFKKLKVVDSLTSQFVTLNKSVSDIIVAFDKKATIVKNMLV
jgi:hypothetical protein